MSDWSETKVLLHELEQLFTRNDDVSDVVDINKMEREIEIQRSHHLKDSKELIKTMTTQLAAKEVDIIAPSHEEHAATLKKMSNKENLSSEVDSLLKAIDTKTTNVSKMASTALSLKERAHDFTISSDMADSRTAYAISLYAKITNITWDYSNNRERGGIVLRGCVGNDARKEFSDFSIDASTRTAFEVANDLWDIVGQSFATAPNPPLPHHHQ
jgi:hypothetical protein